jgi:hypothetical protein
MLRELLTTQVLHQWTQMHQYGKELRFMMVKSMVRKNIKKMPMIFKLTVKSKKKLPTKDSHMHQLYKLVLKLQLKLLRTTQDFHTLMLLVLITQELLRWIQMHPYGKELPFMTEKFMVKSNIKKMLMISKLTVNNKKLLQTLDFHMPQLLRFQHQQA